MPFKLFKTVKHTSTILDMETKEVVNVNEDRITGAMNGFFFDKLNPMN